MANAEVAVLPTGPFKFVCFSGGKNGLYISPIDNEQDVPISHKEIAEAVARRLGMLPDALLPLARGGICMILRKKSSPEEDLSIRYVDDTTELPQTARPKDLEEALLKGISVVVFKKRKPVVRDTPQHLLLIKT